MAEAIDKLTFTECLTEWNSNGPSEAGIAAGVDLLAVAMDGLVVPKIPDKEARAIKAVILNPAPAGASNEAALTYAAAVAWFASRPELREPRKFSEVESAPATVEEAAQLPKISKRHFQNAHDIALSCKVNWWTINHHTGQGKIQGYFAKFYKAVLKWEDTEPNIKVCWRIGHWMHTAEAVGHLLGKPREGLGPIADDITKRMASRPAGCAMLFDTIAILDATASSPLAFMVPQSVAAQYKVLKDFAAKVASTPQAYHQGASVLGYAKKLDVLVPDTYLQGVCKAILDVAFHDSTLAKAAVYQKVAADQTVLIAMGQFMSEYKKIGTYAAQKLMGEGAAVVNGITGDALGVIDE